MDTASQKPTRTFTSFFRHVKTLGFDPAICIDVGAADGTREIYESFPGSLHLAFEPLEDFIPALGERLSPYKHKIYNCALMEKDGSLEILRQQNNLYTSSLSTSFKKVMAGLFACPSGGLTI